MKKRILFSAVLLCALWQMGAAQKHIVVLGSSTAAGTGANPIDSAWVNRLQAHFRKNITAGNPDTLVTNLAAGGYTTYHVLPTGTVNPNGMPFVDPARNITHALSLNPDLILINLPSNDITWGISKKTTMDNFRILRDEMNAAGKRWFITTSQPRNLPSADQRDSLRKLVDSIQINFGYFSIDFWNDIATTDGSNMILPIVNSDGTHVNNMGHRILFEKVIAKELFPVNAPLPVRFVDFQLRLDNGKTVVQWETTGETTEVSYEIERSINGTVFQSIGAVDGKGGSLNQYQWTDQATPAGRTFYRIKALENNTVLYSKILSIATKSRELAIQQLSLSSQTLTFTINSTESRQVELEVYQLSGALVKKSSQRIQAGVQTLSIQLPALAAADYLISIRTAEGLQATQRFRKLN